MLAINICFFVLFASFGKFYVTEHFGPRSKLHWNFSLDSRPIGLRVLRGSRFLDVPHLNLLEQMHRILLLMLDLKLIYFLMNL